MCRRTTYGPAFTRRWALHDATWSRAAGLTLVELLVVMAILAVIVSVAVPAYSKSQERTRVAQAVIDIATMNVRLTQYVDDNRSPPPSLAGISEAGKLDPWGRPYVYTNLITANQGQARKNKNLVPINSQFDLYSMGADGQSVPPITAAKSQDDVILASDGRFVGLASDYK